MKSFNSLILNAKKFLNDQNYRVLALQGGAGPGDTVSVAVSGDLRPVPV